MALVDPAAQLTLRWSQDAAATYPAGVEDWSGAGTAIDPVDRAFVPGQIILPQHVNYIGKELEVENAAAMAVTLANDNFLLGLIQADDPNNGGVQRIRTVPNIPNLRGITDHNVNQIVQVVGYGLYRFDIAGAPAELDPWIVRPTDIAAPDAGRWRHWLYDIFGNIGAHESLPGPLDATNHWLPLAQIQMNGAVSAVPGPLNTLQRLPQAQSPNTVICKGNQGINSTSTDINVFTQTVGSFQGNENVYFSCHARLASSAATLIHLDLKVDNVTQITRIYDGNTGGTTAGYVDIAFAWPVNGAFLAAGSHLFDVILHNGANDTITGEAHARLEIMHNP